MSKISVEDSHRLSPFRKPVWRWLLAESLHRQGYDPGALADFGVAEALLYMRALERAETIDLYFTEMAAAHAIYLDGGPVRDEIEARKLAGELSTQISNKTKISLDVIRTYTITFYDVEPWLDATAWLGNEAIDMSVGMDQALTEGQIWKYWALAGGSPFVDLLVADFHGRVEPRHPDRRLLAQKARLLAWERVTGYSLADTANVIEKLCPLFLGPAGGSDSDGKRDMLRALERLLITTNLWAKAVSGIQEKELKRESQIHPGKPTNSGQLNVRKENAHGRAQQESKDGPVDGWLHRRRQNPAAQS